jgi:hypothetical protein
MLAMLQTLAIQRMMRPTIPSLILCSCVGFSPRSNEATIRVTLRPACRAQQRLCRVPRQLHVTHAGALGVRALVLRAAMNTRDFGEDHEEAEQKQSHHREEYDQQKEREVQD